MASIRSDLSTGRRIYVSTKYGEPFVEEIKKIGGHWDAEKKMWWVSPQKRPALEEALVRADRELARRQEAGEPEFREDPNSIRLTGKCRYKGREYYAGAISKDGKRVRLLTLPDAKGNYLDFWANCAEVVQTKQYEPREVWDGRRHSGRTRTVYTTLGSIAEFIRDQKAQRQAGSPACPSCGIRGKELIHDLETGLRVCSKCCDMPE